MTRYLNFFVVPHNVEAQYEKFVPQKFVYSYQRGDCEGGTEINHRKIIYKIKYAVLHTIDQCVGF